MSNKVNDNTQDKANITALEEIFKDKGGKPPKYKTIEEIEDKIIQYFDLFLSGETKTKEGKEKAHIKQTSRGIYGTSPTITGLALFMGFKSRQSIHDYMKKKKYSYALKRALSLIEMNYEHQLKDRNCTGVIFALKNLGWTDKQEIEQTGGAPVIKIYDTKG